LVIRDERDLIQLEQGIDHGNYSIFVTTWLYSTESIHKLKN